jgi:plasmid stabilization system protein ParE
MNQYVVTAPAEEDLFAIWSYIASDNVQAADRVESEIYSGCRFLAAHPQAGHSRSDLTNRPVRFWSLPRYSNYLIVYDPTSVPLRILRILNGALDAARELNAP